MTDLNEALVFAKVVELGSFTGAAASLQLPKATVSRRVRDLEARLATRLLNRTTRRVSPTEAGTAYYEHCVVALRELEDAEAAVGHLQGAPRGWLRITAPLTVGRDFLARPIAEFQKRYPEVRVAMLLTNEVVDLVAEGARRPLADRRTGDPRPARGGHRRGATDVAEDGTRSGRPLVASRTRARG